MRPVNGATWSTMWRNMWKICRNAETCASPYGWRNLTRNTTERTRLNGADARTFTINDRGTIGQSMFFLRQSLSGLKKILRRHFCCEACGIMGYIGQKDGWDVLSSGLLILQNRGYDSCGITTISAGKLVTSKYASDSETAVAKLLRNCKPRHLGHHVGIAHTRWATHGGKTDANAHPHHDWHDKISVVHNGTIDNFATLKEWLEKRGMGFRSETDTEVVANLIGYWLLSSENFEHACRRAIGSLRGTWGLAVVYANEPDKIVVARNGSPILLGGDGQEEIYIASETSAIAKYSNSMLALTDGDLVIAQLGRSLQSLGSSDCAFELPPQVIETTPGKYAHWTIKEIHEQPESMGRTLNFGGRASPSHAIVRLGGLDAKESTLVQIDDLLIIGCGSSLYASMFGEVFMRNLPRTPMPRAIDASELEANHFMSKNCGALFISQSGETRDLLAGLQLARSKNAVCFSIVNVVGSQLARETDCGIYMNAGREVGVAATKSFTATAVLLCLVACWFHQQPSKVAEITQEQANLIREQFDSQICVSSDRTEKTASQNDEVQSNSTRSDASIEELVLECCSTCYEHIVAISNMPKLIATVINNNEEKVKYMAQQMLNAYRILVLGRGFGYPIAMEIALKIKELTYIHAEGFSSGALKHGPLSLIDEAGTTHIIAVVLNDATLPAMINTLQQVHARGVQLIVITDLTPAHDLWSSGPGLISDQKRIFFVPKNGALTAILCVVPAQLLAYYIAIGKNFNPDQPRWLAKTVTVT